MPKVNLKRKDVEVYVYLDKSDPEDIVALNAPEETIYETNKIQSDNIFKLITTWRRSIPELEALVDINCSREKVQNGTIQVQYDPATIQEARFKCLLSSWNFQELDESMALTWETSVDNKDVQILSAPSVKKVMRLDSGIVNHLYEKALHKLYVSKSRVIDDFLSQMKVEKEAKKGS